MLHIFNSVRSVTGFFLLLIITLFSGGCKKDGTLQEGPEVAEVSFQFDLPDPDLRLTLYFNDKMLQDSMYPTGRHQAITGLREDIQHLVVANSTTQEVLVDTLLEVTRPYGRIFVIGASAGNKPLVVTAEEANVEPGYVRMALIVTDPNIPSGVDVHIYQVYYDEYEGVRKVDMNPVAVISDIQQGVMTDYTMLYRHPDGSMVYELRDKTGALVPGFNNNEVKPDDWLEGGGRIDLAEGHTTQVFRLRTFMLDSGVPHLMSSVGIISY